MDTVLIQFVKQQVRKHGFGLDRDDQADVVQVVLIDAWRHEYLQVSTNRGALVQRIKFHVCNAVRSNKRHDGRGNGRFVSLDALADDSPGYR